MSVWKQASPSTSTSRCLCRAVTRSNECHSSQHATVGSIYGQQITHLYRSLHKTCFAFAIFTSFCSHRKLSDLTFIVKKSMVLAKKFIINCFQIVSAAYIVYMDASPLIGIVYYYIQKNLIINLCDSKLST